jgi:hypothetical protein
MALQDFLLPFGGKTNTNYPTAVAPIATTAVWQPGQFAGALSNNLSAYMGGLGQAANGYTGNYGVYGNGIGKLGDAYTAGMNGLAGGLGALGGAASNTYGAYANGLGQIGNSAAQMYGSNAQGLAGMGNAYTQAYGAYGAGLGNVAGAMSNERANFYTANAQAEAARQMANANLGAAALGAAGGASSGALSAWAQDRTAYNKSLSDLAAANQMAMSSYGQSRNTALGGLGQSYADTTKGLGAAMSLGNINFAMNGGGGGAGDNGFLATGPDGQIASGSYGGGSGAGGFSASGSRTSNPDNVTALTGPAYGGLGSLRDNLMAGDITGGMTSNYKTGLDALREDHARGENMPSSLLDQSFRGFKDLAGQGYAQTQGGMNQYYATQNDPRNKSDYSGILGQLASGYQGASGGIGSAQSAMNSNYNSGMNMLGGLAPQLGAGLSGTLADLRGYGAQMGNGFAANNRNLGTLGTQLGTGYTQSNQNVGGAVAKMDSGFSSGNSALSNLWDTSMGNMELFQSPAEIARKQREADAMKKQYSAEDQRAADLERAATRSRLLQMYTPDQLKSFGLG